MVGSGDERSLSSSDLTESSVKSDGVQHSGKKRGQQQRRNNPSGHGVTFSGKIKPPLLHGASTGLFSTRSPHRPNPIGLTLARIEHVSPANRRLEVSGIDLCDETPILDIKPYVPGDIPAEIDSACQHKQGLCSEACDQVSGKTKSSSVRFAAWTQAEQSRSWKVGFSAMASEKLSRLAGATSSQFYKSPAELQSAIADILRLDVRSVSQGRAETSNENGTKTNKSKGDEKEISVDANSSKVVPTQHQCVVDSVQVFFVVDSLSFSILVNDALPYDAASQLRPI